MGDNEVVASALILFLWRRARCRSLEMVVQRRRSSSFRDGCAMAANQSRFPRNGWQARDPQCIENHFVARETSGSFFRVCPTRARLVFQNDKLPNTLFSSLSLKAKASTMAVVVVSSRNNSPRSSNSSSKRQLSSWMGPSLLLVLGCVLGHWHGRYYSAELLGLGQPPSASASSSALLQVLHDNNNNPHTTVCNCVEDGNGWNSIQVFYGKTDLFEDSTNNTAASGAPELVGQQKPQPQEQRRLAVRWYSQAKQDELVHALLRNKTHGFFVDLAANDATVLSNTYALETSFHWKGVCIEPNPLYWANLSLQRPGCTIIGAVVGAARLQPVHFRFEAGDHGGIADAGFDNGKRWQRSSERRYTVTLLEILRERVVGAAPVDIDYLSLDVEGACVRACVRVCVHLCLFHVSLLSVRK